MCLKIRTGLSFGLLALAVSSLSGRAQTCTVNWTNVYQRIDGFGASSAWQGTWTTTEADMFFSTNNGIVYTDNATPKNTTTNNGIGLSLLRNHITYASSPSPTATPTTSEWNIMQYAQARGARVWSAPWTPAAGLKSTNDIYDSNHAAGGGLDGGSYLGSGANATNLAYASQLANYVVSMKNNYNINLYAISIQNEPDADVTGYEACQWTGAQIHDFTTNLYNALVTAGVGSTKIVLPESQDWDDPDGLAAAVMGDSNVAPDVGIIADHDYDGANGSKNSYGKALWETEVSLLYGSDSSITNGVYWGQQIYQFMTVAQANAYHYWWLMSGNSTGNQGLLDNKGSITKRFFVFGQYSRFVRPNFYRIGATTTGTALISAYNNTSSSSSNFAIVAVNTSTSTAISQTFNLTNFPTVSSVTPWITSATMSLSNQTPVTVNNASFTYTLPALSVVTFVGQAAVTTTVGLITSSNPSTYGNAVTFTATVRTNGVAVGGISGETVTFYDGGTQLGTGTVNGSGQAAYTTSATQLSAAAHSITAVYGGDNVYAGSTNAPALSQTVSQTTLTYTANPASMIYGSAVPGLGGSVGGFVGSDTQANATTGTLAFTTAATSSSSVGSYAINGSGLTANNGNYAFAQAAGNATALGILPLVTPAFAGQGIVVGSGGWQLSFSAQAGQSYQVLAAGDLTLPVSQWTVVTNGTFGAGTVTITDNSTNLPVRFYRIVSP